MSRDSSRQSGKFGPRVQTRVEIKLLPVTAQYLYLGPPLQGGIKPQHPVVGRLHTSTVLLGLWMASWQREPSPELALATGIGPSSRVPLGMGIVVPANKIAETLNDQELTVARQNEYQRRLKERAAETDSLQPNVAPASPVVNASPNHREDFTSLLTAAAKTKPQDDET